MSTPKFSCLAAAFGLLLLTGCNKNLIVVIPDTADGHIGAVVVESNGNKAVLDTAYAAATPGSGALKPATSDAKEVKEIFGTALTAQPPTPMIFTLYFINGTDDLTPDSKPAFEKIFADAQQRKACLLYTSRQDWEEALLRWQDIRARFDDHWVGYTGSAGALRQLGRLDEAGQLLNAAGEKYSTEYTPTYELARLAEHLRDWASAELHWSRLIALNPALPSSVAGLANALSRQGRADDADALLLEGRDRFPGNEELAVAAAEMSVTRGDRAEAVRRFEAARSLYPQSHGIAVRLIDELLRLDRREEALDKITDALSSWPSDRLFLQRQIETLLRLREYSSAFACLLYTSNQDYQVRIALSEMIYSGVFERFPRLKIGAIEHELSWIPVFLQRLDYNYTDRPPRGPEWRRFDDPNVMPSDFFKRNVFVSFQEDPYGLRMRDVYSTDVLLWGSDYPHTESTFPRSREILGHILEDVDRREIPMIVSGNAARVYGFDLA